MKINQPVTQAEKPYPSGRYLVSKTDLKGAITYVNETFVELSGFSREELLGKNHNIVRHPDMPPQAFEDLWRTIKEGLPWTGIVKNRAKNGDHYWVKAFVVPVRENDAIVGYMSARSEPARAEVAAAEKLYRKLNETRGALDTRPPFLTRISIKTRLIAIMALVVAMLVGGAVVGINGIRLTNEDLREAYQERLRPSLAIAKMIDRLGDNRAQVMLGLQHDPGNPHSKLHAHLLDMHIDATLKNREIIEALRADYEKRSKKPEEAALAKAFFEARDAFSKEGVSLARDALKAGDYDKASVLLLTKINPLYKEVSEKGAALEEYLAKSGEADYAASQARYELVRNMSVFGTLAALVVILVASIYLLRSIIAPLQRVLGHFDRISQGNLTDEIDISGRDEAGRVLTSLAAMQVHLKVMLDEVTMAAGAIERQSHRLEDETATVVEKSEEQRDRVRSVAAATEEFSQSVNEVAASADGTARAAVSAQIEVSASHESMDRSITATGRVVAAVETSSHTMADLNQAIAKIGDITQVIKDIADQTNLLALNAAIEAARAGEQGRGFAVVADEVRKLAERTSTSTADITATVSEIREVTRAALASMSHAVEEVEQGTGLIRESGAGLDRITAASRDVTDKAQHIAAAAQEQALASEQVASNMEQIAALIDSNVSAAQQAKSAAEDLLGTAADLRKVVGQFRIVQ